MAGFEVYKDGKSEYRWRIRAANNEIVADSAEGYKSEAGCRRAVARLQQLVAAGGMTSPPESEEPMVKLDPGGRASILSYNVPEPTSYTGRTIIELSFPEEYFQPTLNAPPELRSSIANLDATTYLAELNTGFAGSTRFPNAYVSDTTDPKWLALKTKLAASEGVCEVLAMAVKGRRLNIHRSLAGEYEYNFLPDPTEVRPRILLVETYRLSSFLGSYGAGRTVNTFTLLPGEKTAISIRTYRHITAERTASECVLDSFSEESARELQSAVQNEQQSRSALEFGFQYYVDTNASANWGMVQASGSAGISGGVNGAQEEFAKNISSATANHVAKSSRNRSVEVNTTSKVTETTGEETAIVRELANVNNSRTLNFIFRQMNQEFITILHLVDVRVAFFNGYGELRQEVALPELDALLNRVLVGGKESLVAARGIEVLDPKNSKVLEVRTAILDALSCICDYQDNVHSFVEERKYTDQGTVHSYWRVKKNHTSTYRDEATGTEIVVPGIILAAQKHVLRTDGIIVDAVLGQGEALDEHQHRAEEEKVRDGVLANDLAELRKQREALGQKIIRDKDKESAALFREVFSTSAATGEPQ